MSEFFVYLRLGIHHILDARAVDHLLFITALTLPYSLREWRALLWLVTAFTVGHSLTLALATLDLVRINPAVVEVLIPITILLTSIATIGRVGRASGAANPPSSPGRSKLQYAIALAFGLIHGLGFSTFLRALLGNEESIARPLFSFNVGLEIAQLVVVSLVLAVTAVMTRFLTRAAWQLALSGATGALAAAMVIERIPR